MSSTWGNNIRLSVFGGSHTGAIGVVLDNLPPNEKIDLDAVRMVGYGFQVEMKYTAWKLGFRIDEVSIVFVDRTEGISKMSGGIFGEAFWGVLKLPWRRIRPKLPAARE